MERTCEYKDCTACYACFLSCNFKAIEMKENEFGYILPHINEQKCKDCGKCRKVCHICKDVEKHSILKSYAGIAINKEIYTKSSSGGFATVLAQYVLDNDGIVYGAAFDDELKLRHLRITDVNDLPKIQGSKYVESILSDTYNKVKGDIATTTTLFTGTPCQVAGLLAYLGNINSNNLITMSFICGGIASNKFLEDSLGRKKKNLKGIIFRKGAQAALWLSYRNGKNKYLSRYLNPYLIGYYYKLTERLSCFNCKYSTMDRVGDITVGDFWGLKEGRFVDSNSQGVSIILPTTDKGCECLDKIRELIDIEERNVQETIPYNHRLLTPSQYGSKTKVFRYLCNKLGFNLSVILSIGVSYWYMIAKRYTKKVILALIRNNKS